MCANLNQMESCKAYNKTIPFKVRTEQVNSLNNNDK